MKITPRRTTSVVSLAKRENLKGEEDPMGYNPTWQQLNLPSINLIRTTFRHVDEDMNRAASARSKAEFLAKQAAKNLHVYVEDWEQKNGPLNTAVIPTAHMKAMIIGYLRQQKEQLVIWDFWLEHQLFLAPTAKDFKGRPDRLEDFIIDMVNEWSHSANVYASNASVMSTMMKNKDPNEKKNRPADWRIYSDPPIRKSDVVSTSTPQEAGPPAPGVNNPSRNKENVRRRAEDRQISDEEWRGQHARRVERDKIEDQFPYEMEGYLTYVASRCQWDALTSEQRRLQTGRGINQSIARERYEFLLNLTDEELECRRRGRREYMDKKKIAERKGEIYPELRFDWIHQGKWYAEYFDPNDDPEWASARTSPV